MALNTAQNVASVRTPLFAAHSLHSTFVFGRTKEKGDGLWDDVRCWCFGLVSTLG